MSLAIHKTPSDVAATVMGEARGVILNGSRRCISVVEAFAAGSSCAGVAFRGVCSRIR